MGEIDVEMQVEEQSDFLFLGKQLDNEIASSPDDGTVLEERFSLDTDVPTQLDIDLDITTEIYTDSRERNVEESEDLKRGVTVDDIFRDSDDEEEEDSIALEASQKVLDLVQAFKIVSSPAHNSAASDTDSEDSEREGGIAGDSGDSNSDAGEIATKKASKNQSIAIKKSTRGSGRDGQENGVVQSEIE
ncbi:hypothetical protein EON65_54845, partial [archaeon]